MSKLKTVEKTTTKSTLLKEAIADAKIIRETALENAKAILAEAFTPKLQSMLSGKLAEEDEQDDVPAEGEEETPAEDAAPEGEEASAPAPAAAPAEGEEAPAEEAPAEGDEDEDLDLEAVIRELEGGEEQPIAEEEAPADPNAMKDEDDLDEIIKSLSEDADADEKPAEDEKPVEEDVKNEVATLQAELKEAMQVVQLQKRQLQEINMINAKLLYMNKIFKAAELTEAKKTKILEAFDRATTLREVKMIYATLSEALKSNKQKDTSAKTKVKKLTESLGLGASGRVKGTKPILEESFDFSDRFRELAGMKKQVKK